jgi:hypothetical protein
MLLAGCDKKPEDCDKDKDDPNSDDCKNEHNTGGHSGYVGGFYNSNTVRGSSTEDERSAGGRTVTPEEEPSTSGRPGVGSEESVGGRSGGVVSEGEGAHGFGSFGGIGGEGG